MADLNKEFSIWITAEDFGTVRTLRVAGRTIEYRIPKEIDRQVTLRFKGYGRTVSGESGDVLLIVRVDRGRDIQGDLWLSATQAEWGCVKILRCGSRRISVSVPSGSKDRQTIRIPNAGKKLPYRWGLPLFARKRGDAIITLRVFSEIIEPQYQQWDHLSTDALSLEGWIYRRYDDVVKRLGNFPHKQWPFLLQNAADAFNEGGWREIAGLLRRRLISQAVSVDFKTSPTLKMPGLCEMRTVTRGTDRTTEYTITIRAEFTDDPFAVTAILAHELCHIVENHLFGQNRQNHKLEPSEVLDIERTVDLLVFLCQLGDFQIRVARDRRITFGYFNQELFERMYVILSRKREGAKTGQ